MRGKRTHRLLSILLVAVMLLTMLPATAYAEGTTNSDTFYKIVHVDCGRKYFSPENIKTIIDNAAAAGFNQVELYLSDNQGFRFALDDMNVTTSTGNTYNLTPALGDGYSDGSKYPDGSGKYLTQSEMTDIISYAAGKGIEIVPCINVPGHMGAILEEFTQFKYSGSNSSIDLENAEAVAFALAITEKYATYFESRGVKFYNIGADEYANDLSTSTMGFQGLYTSGKYQKFVDFLNSAAQIVSNHKMTPRAFNDGIYYNEDNTYSINSAIQVCYWSCGWSGYNLASAQYIVNQGMDVINTHGDYYWVLGNAGWQCSAEKASQFDYTSFQYRTGTTGNGTISNPAGAMFCIWCDVGDANGTDDGTAVVSATADVIAAFGAALPASETGEGNGGTTEGGTDGSADVEVTENEIITVTKGQTATATISGYNFAGTYTTEDLSIATVEVTGTDATEATTTYTQASVTCDTLISSNSKKKWTAVSGYYYKADDGNYYPLYAKRSSSGYIFKNYTYTWGYSTTGSTSNVTEIGTQSTYDTSTTPNITVYTKSETEGTPASTTVTFTGVTVGTTYVTVGNTRYTIKVVAEDLSTVTPLTVEYWITNLQVTADGATSKAISAQSAYGEAGVDVSTLVPATGTYDWGSVVYWKGTVLDSSNKQTTAGGVENDKTGSGKDFHLIRYYNGSWQYFYEADGTWNTISDTDQVVVYWLQPTKVTKEITTLVKDWGFAPNAQGDNENKVALTVAVVYPDGTVSPAEGDMYSTSTTLFNYWSGRDIGLVAPVNNSDYEIAKITVTNGTRDQRGTGQWGANDTITWDKVPNEAGKQWYNETTYWDETVGGTPMVNGVTSHITWSNYNTAKLVLIYLKPVHYDTNLTVKWVDDSANGALISTMEVAVSSDGTPITFYNGLKQTSALPTEGVGGTFTLDDDAYVTNSSNVNQTFNKEISTVPDVAEKYQSGLYQYVSADLSADGMTLTLHYNLNSGKIDKTYVLDFGLPVKVPLSDLVENPGDVRVEILDESGAARYDEAAKSIIFTPSAVMNNIIPVRVKLTFGDNSTQTIKIGFIPASNVLYEDSFLALDETNNGVTEWKHTDATSNATQSYEQNSLYGYDVAYKEENKGNSLDSNWTVSVPNSDEYSKFLTTSFYGNGFDLIGTAGEDTGMVYLLLKGESTGLTSKLIIIDTSYVDGKETTLYQVPLAHEALEEGNYTAYVRAAYRAATGGSTEDTASGASYSMRSTMSTSGDAVSDVYAMVDELFMDGFEIDDVEFVYFDESSPLAELNNATAAVATYAIEPNETTSDSTAVSRPAGTTVTIDGFRVYRSSGNTSYLESEQGVKYVNVLEATLNGDSFNAYVENQDRQSWTKENYEANGGPQNEVYLGSTSDAIAFKVNPNATVQISARAATSAPVTLRANGIETEIKTNTEMYYKVTADKNGIVTIQNSGVGLLALGNLKLPAGSELAELTADDEPIVFSLLRMAPASVEPEPEPEPVFTPSKLDVKVKRISVLRNKLVTVTVTASTDVATLTVNGRTLKPTNSLLVKYGLSKNYVYVYSETLNKSESKDYVVVAYDENGVASEAVTAHN